MAIEAPLSRYKRNNLFIIIAILLVAGGWFAYDGYFNEKFIDEHSDKDGNPDSTLVFNRKSPPIFIAGILIVGAYLFTLRGVKIIADDQGLNINGKESIKYDSIQQVSKTHFDSKGFFIITYKNSEGAAVERKISDRTYDNLSEVLDRIVEKIS